MRELKFRVWDSDTCAYSDCAFMLDRSGGLWLYGTDGITLQANSTRFIAEQFTGLKDKNEREIYEGDIVALNEQIDVVDLSRFRYWLRNEDFGYEGEGLISPDYCEVIGNIHENPELLGGR